MKSSGRQTILAPFFLAILICLIDFDKLLFIIDLDEQTLWTLQERQAIYYQNLFLISQKRKNDNKGPENVLQCEGGSYLDLQYKFNDSIQ